MSDEDWAAIARSAEQSMLRQGRSYDAGSFACLAEEIEHQRAEIDQLQAQLNAMVKAEIKTNAGYVGDIQNRDAEIEQLRVDLRRFECVKTTSKRDVRVDMVLAPAGGWVQYSEARARTERLEHALDSMIDAFDHRWKGSQKTVIHHREKALAEARTARKGDNDE